MKLKIALLIAVIVGAIGGSWIKNLPGFVIIAYDKTSYEMRLWIAITLLLLLLACLFMIGIFLRSLISGANRVKDWQGGRHWRKARKQTIQGMLAFVEGRWKQAENTMINAAKNSDTKLINYLIAAQAAQQQKAEDRRDSYLRLAHKSAPKADIAIGLTQAQLQLDSEQLEQALASLNELRIKNTNHPFILKLLSETYTNLKDWDAIIELLPVLKKQKVYSLDELKEIEFKSIAELLEREFNKNDLESLKQAWLSLSTNSKKDYKIVVCYARLLVRFEEMDEAEKLVKPLFKKTPDTEIIKAYGEIKSSFGTKQFNFLETWFNNNSQAPNSVYLALGKIAFNVELWGKARYYFERSLRVDPTAESYFRMAKTLQKLDDMEHASECFQQGLEFVVEPEKSKQALLLTKAQGKLPAPS